MIAISFPTHLAHISHGAKLSRHFVLMGVLSLGSFVSAQAHPLDSPDIVYIDGVPCNSACQSYMAWSHKTRERNSVPAPAITQSANHKVGRTKVTSVAAPKRLVPMPPMKEVVPVPREAPRAQTAELQPFTGTIPEDHPLQAHTAPPVTETEAPPTQTATLKTQAAPETQVAAPASVSDRTIEEQILAATALAEQLTAASTSRLNEKVAENSGQSESIGTKDDGDNKQAVSPPQEPDLVVLILARADIKSIADLANKDIAIEGKQSQFREQIRTGIVAAGAPMVELRGGKGSAINRLVSGEQPAAVLTLASPEAADWFPEIKGFRTFRVPLSPS
jgi:hypothetical protein